MTKSKEPKPDVSSRKVLWLIDDVLEQCAGELQFLAELYHKHGLSIQARELFLASENIRRNYDSTQREKAKAS